MSNRATGRTTRMLHLVVEHLIANKTKDTKIIVVAYNDNYATDLWRKTLDVLAAYGCIDIFTIPDIRKIERKNCSVEFMGEERYTYSDYAKMGIFTTIYDHYIKR